MAKIAIIGSGRVGGTLGHSLEAAGHKVTFGGRDGMAEAVDGADVVILALPGAAVAEVVSGLGNRLDGKTVIDAANNVGGDVMHSRAALTAAAPSAAYVRAFNTLGFEVMGDSVVDGVQADMYFCCPDGACRALTEGLINDVGLRPVWVGGPEEVETVDGMLRIWLTLVRKQGHSRRTAFKMFEERP